MAARIYQRPRSSTQSGRAHSGQWLLEHESASPKRPDPLTGWSGGEDTVAQVRIAFPTVDAAIEYAQKHGLDYHVVPSARRSLKIQAYADNFTRGPVA